MRLRTHISPLVKSQHHFINDSPSQRLPGGTSPCPGVHSQRWTPRFWVICIMRTRHKWAIEKFAPNKISPPPPPFPKRRSSALCPLLHLVNLRFCCIHLQIYRYIYSNCGWCVVICVYGWVLPWIVSKCCLCVFKLYSSSVWLEFVSPGIIWIKMGVWYLVFVFVSIKKNVNSCSVLHLFQKRARKFCDNFLRHVDKYFSVWYRQPKQITQTEYYTILTCLAIVMRS